MTAAADISTDTSVHSPNQSRITFQLTAGQHSGESGLQTDVSSGSRGEKCCCAVVVLGARSLYLLTLSPFSEQHSWFRCHTNCKLLALLMVPVIDLFLRPPKHADLPSGQVRCALSVRGLVGDCCWRKNMREIR